MNVGLWQIISTTDLISKLVLLTLLGMSVICWAFALYKRKTILLQLKQIKQALALLQNTKGMDDFLARISVMHNTYAGELITNFLSDFKRVLKGAEQRRSSLESDWDLLHMSINQRVDELLAKEASMIPLLSTSAQAAPLIGLFGTVWGLIHAFMGIAAQKSADISAVAPGIAEALVTTMGGLVVAIPALVLFNYLQLYMSQLESAVVELADNCLWIMKGVLVSPDANGHAMPSVKQGHAAHMVQAQE